MDEAEAPLVLSPATAKKRFFLYLLLKLIGFGGLFAGVLLARGGPTPAAIIVLLLGAATLFIRPRHLGLTTRPERPRR